MSAILMIPALIIGIVSVFSALPPSPPPFSWDKIPLFMHAQNGSGPLNETAAKYMASFPIVTIEKAQDGAGLKCEPTSTNCEEDRIIAALKQIRSINPNARTIFYLNSMINYPQYNLSAQFMGSNEKYLLHDQNGNLIYLGNCHGPNDTVFDLSYNQAVSLWLNTVKYAMTSVPGVVDGVFADRGSTNISQYQKCMNLTDEKVTAWNKGHISMLQQAQELITSVSKDRGILIANNANIQGVNARMFENYRYDDTWENGDETRDDIIALMNEKGQRISEVHGEENYGSFNYNQTVTAYLIGAYEYSYYASTAGWTLQTGWDEMWQNPDYDKALGAPVGDGSYDNKTKVWTREFKSGTKVYIDLEWNYPCIKWGDGTMTGNKTDCNRYN